MSAPSELITRGWTYVRDQQGRLRRRAVGSRGRVEVLDRSGHALSTATRVRAASALGRALEVLEIVDPVSVVLHGAGARERLEQGALHLDGPGLVGAPLAEVEARVLDLAAGLEPAPRPALELPGGPPPRVLFFESLMNTDMPHNDRELSQGVLHMASSLSGTGAEVVLANVKMPIQGDRRPASGLETLDRALSGGPIGLVCVTLLEGYFEAVVELIGELRRRGCRARVAVGGVMPTLSPEQVAAHLPEVSFVCRGAGEVFLPRLVEILGNSEPSAPFTEAQRRALLSLDGLIALDRDSLVSANSAQVVEVGDLDRVPLALEHLERRHLQGGMELSTSRGCLHRCTFCSILGRESYQARSAEGVFELLGRYEDRFRQLFGDTIPNNAYRLHISDDDFACDLGRACDFFRGLLETPFRLSSVQVSVADLCVRRDGKLTTELHPELLEVLKPELFADEGRPIPTTDFVLDHKSRSWSSYLQLGVETFSERELVRLGKGYKRAHIRAVAAALDARRIHMDAYFIQSNSETSASDLVDSVEELCRLKLRHPRHVHLRFPVVPHLVSYFPSASHRRKLQQGKEDTMALRGRASTPGHPELDYPFVDHDLPGDAWVEVAVRRGFLSDVGRYTQSLVQLRAHWTDRLDQLSSASDLRDGRRLVRRLDDAPRRLVFDLLAQSRRLGRGAEDPDWPGLLLSEDRALSTAEELLGPRDRWLPAFRRYSERVEPRLVVIPTWQCELRCRYCYIPKQDGRVMSPEVLDRSIDLLLSSERPSLILQMFGGEALLEWGLVQQALTQGHQRAQAAGKNLRFILSSNGYSLDAEKLAWLERFPVKLELSLDGDPETQNRFRRAWKQGDSYQMGIAPRAADILASGLEHEVIMVVHPANVDRMPDNFFHIAGLGFQRVQINFALGSKWSSSQQKSFATGLFQIGEELRRRWARGDPLMMVNLEGRPMPIRLNGEITVDWDGTLYGGNAFLHETPHKDKFRLGRLNDFGHFDRYWMDAPSNELLLEYSYEAAVTRNNLAVGRILTSFMTWMQQQPLGAGR